MAHANFQCPSCRRHRTSLIAGTVFQSTHLPLTIWFLAIHLISQVKTGLSALALKRQLGVSYPTAWRIHHKLTQAMVKREEIYTLQDEVRADDAYLGCGQPCGRVSRGSENKVPFVAAVPLDEQHHPVYAKFTAIIDFPRTADWAQDFFTPYCTALADGLAHFNGVADACCHHDVMVAGGRKPRGLPQFLWVNTLLSNLKTSTSGAYHAFKFSKYTQLYLSVVTYRFNHRFRHADLPASLFRAAASVAPRSERWGSAQECNRANNFFERGNFMMVSHEMLMYFFIIMRLRFPLVPLLFLIPSASAAPLDLLVHDPLDTQGLVKQPLGQIWHDPQLKLPQIRLPKEQTFTKAQSLAALTTYALAHNPQTRVAFENLQASAVGLGVAESAWLPSLSLTDNAARSQSNTTAGFSIPILNSNSDTLSLSYVLLDFGLRSAQRDAALAQIYISGFNNNSALTKVALTVTQNYYQLIGEQALVRAYAQTVKEDEANLDAAQLKQHAGMATIADVLQAKSALAQAQAQLISAQATVRSDNGALAGSCGLSPGNAIPIVPLNTHRLPPHITPSVHSLVLHATQNNPSVQAAAAQILASRATLREDQAQGLPTLSASVSGGKRFQNGLGPSQNWAIGLSLKVPLFTGFHDSYQIQQARRQERSARASLNQETQSIALTVYQDYQTVMGARSAAKAAQIAVNSAQASLAAIRAQYKVGLSTMLNLLTAQATLTTAEQTRIQDITTAYVQLANLANALGMIGLPNTTTGFHS
ncbi:IS1595 family transposase [Acidithiobacillus ferrooxidans]|uniref:IS1595 family transposase n=3 Tax=Acidithiobacillus ferrooxidans TaxID=920 RepID=A0A2W1K0I5_ACIFR|nr:IS1595 family transposase [Acidithiobacillus ferrooxidans]PZD79890.1 IS1595 family transposase [Acidithiobacillus ferrooxidans]QLK42364.1 IS1595 family transposase [Acidithiobacillus ferrooxidans]QZT51435.1 IS1595 family transposase [Acidithiobacillus ferrooxidans]RRN83230.1 MAG: IS1595 family transposase [Acidithiobacillus ferrooxidans]